MSDLRSSLIKLAHDHPELRERLMPLLRDKQAARGDDPAVDAYDLISWLPSDPILKGYTSKTAKASQTLEGLKRFQSHHISAPEVLKGLLPEIEELHDHLGMIVKQAKSILQKAR